MLGTGSSVTAAVMLCSADALAASSWASAASLASSTTASRRAGSALSSASILRQMEINKINKVGPTLSEVERRGELRRRGGEPERVRRAATLYRVAVSVI